MIVLTFSDADPAGWQMPISIARKLQAFESLFPNLDYEVRRVALTPDQVREYGLPSTPLKETERRGDKWRTAMLTDQTEIDALASLQPDLLRRIARDAIAPFFDRTLDRRVRDARSRWIAAAQAIVDANTDADLLARLREEAAERLTEMRAQIDAINEACRVDVDEFDISDPVIPAAEADGPTGLPLPLIDSRWDHADQCRRLIAAKNYEDLVPEQIGEVDR
jgi:hypothetical protein